MNTHEWPHAGRVAYDLLIGSVDEADRMLKSRARWEWHWLTRACTVEMIDRAGPGNPGPLVELWRIKWRPWRYDWQTAYVTDSVLHLSVRSGLLSQPTMTGVDLYRIVSFRELAEARSDYEMMARTVRQALRPLA